MFCSQIPLRFRIILTEEASFRDSIVVSISACHADDPGSIPGRGVIINFCFMAEKCKFDVGMTSRVGDGNAWLFGLVV